MTARKYSSIYPDKALNAGVTAAATSIVLNSATSILTSYPYTLVIDPNTIKEEIVTVTASSGATLTVVRGQDGSRGLSRQNALPSRATLQGWRLRRWPPQFRHAPEDSWP